LTCFSTARFVRVLAMVVLAALALIGLAAAVLLPRSTVAPGPGADRSAERHRFA
jgi:hypothetical protein